MRILRLPAALATTVLLLVASSVLLVAPSAGAVGYQGGCALTVSLVSVAPGGSVTARATGFPAGASVHFTLSPDYSLGSVTADSSGAATLTFTAPATIAPGLHTLTAVGEPAGACDPSVSSNINIAGASVTTASESNGLPRTGTDSGTLVYVALGLILLGAVVVAGARARRRRVSIDR